MYHLSSDEALIPVVTFFPPAFHGRQKDFEQGQKRENPVLVQQTPYSAPRCGVI